MRFVVAALLFNLLLVGCAPKAEIALYGNWEGQFSGESSSRQYKGYLQLYATGHKFKLRLGDVNQNYDVTGAWQFTGRQVLLGIQGIAFQGLTKKEAEERKLAYLEPQAVREAYGRQLILNLGPDKKTLEGLPMTIAGFQGSHRFQKAELSSYR